MNCIDNSGASVVQCIFVLGKKFAPAKIGDRVVVVVKKQRSLGADNGVGPSSANKVRRGDVRHAVIVRARKITQRADGSSVKFDDNACVLINKNGEPIGTRINGVVSSQLRDKKWSKILSLAPMDF
ncbi:MAG: hypothetical protein M1814_006173 [Vezdaea aestivalis]|nr:MAG: hypothetical protein M1814_006173 [Vezdaea aestivalis]